MYNIGIDMGGTNLVAGIVNEKYEILQKMSVPTNARGTADAITADIARLCDDVLAKANISFSDIGYIGIATPGSAKCDTGELLYANNLPFRHYLLADKLGSMLAVRKPVYIENDANAAALAEAVAGAAKGVPYSIMITLGTGEGGGIIING